LTAATGTPSRLVLLTGFALLAFAGNSLLTRAALADGVISPGGFAAISPGAFAAIRLASGAAALALLAHRRGAILPGKADLGGIIALFVYAAGFSFAYGQLTTATGALILFASVQIALMAAATIAGRPPRPLEALGIAVALAGLAWLLAPGLAAPTLAATALMVAAGTAWAGYTLLGRGAGDPAARSARNFIGAAPLGLVLLLVPVNAGGGPLHASPAGVALAVASGAVTSGLGYIAWYAVLPRLSVATAGVVQLLVPAVAAAGGALWLGEALSARLLAATAIILSGIALSLFARR
jgi:drug/metabolite transporter (DMT)-like permease